ncbi:MAG: tetratricopeptide repeat protein, partial [Candidatus Latescibacteria bacterium]|nr:tetratricopeptide repeat protein [Candidatus Latescibacterota bacterium]
GIAFLQAENLQLAIVHFEKVIALRPDHYRAHNNLGVVFLRTTQYQKARQQFQEALRIKPTYSDAEVNLTLTQELIQPQ